MLPWTESLNSCIRILQAIPVFIIETSISCCYFMTVLLLVFHHGSVEKQRPEEQCCIAELWHFHHRCTTRWSSPHYLLYAFIAWTDQGREVGVELSLLKYNAVGYVIWNPYTPCGRLLKVLHKGSVIFN